MAVEGVGAKLEDRFRELGSDGRWNGTFVGGFLVWD
jgi:hypothetical protein